MHGFVLRTGTQPLSLLPEVRDIFSATHSDGAPVSVSQFALLSIVDVAKRALLRPCLHAIADERYSHESGWSLPRKPGPLCPFEGISLRLYHMKVYLRP